jgi:endogenous inhibitor of DNA gyrase (YacG/DUF329 family)
MNMKHKCPICGKVFRISRQEESQRTELFPFCSRRCKLMDLGTWLDGEYKIVYQLDLNEHNDEIDTTPTYSNNE